MYVPTGRVRLANPTEVLDVVAAVLVFVFGGVRHGVAVVIAVVVALWLISLLSDKLECVVVFDLPRLVQGPKSGVALEHLRRKERTKGANNKRSAGHSHTCKRKHRKPVGEAHLLLEGWFSTGVLVASHKVRGNCQNEMIPAC